MWQSRPSSGTCGAALRRAFALDTHDRRRARSETQFGNIEDAIDHVAPALHAIIHELGAFPGDHEERRQIARCHCFGHFDPGAPTVIEDTRRHPTWSATA